MLGACRSLHPHWKSWVEQHQAPSCWDRHGWVTPRAAARAHPATGGAGTGDWWRPRAQRGSHQVAPGSRSPPPSPSLPALPHHPLPAWGASWGSQRGGKGTLSRAVRHFPSMPTQPGSAPSLSHSPLSPDVLWSPLWSCCCWSILASHLEPIPAHRGAAVSPLQGQSLGYLMPATQHRNVTPPGGARRAGRGELREQGQENQEQNSIDC